MTVSVFTCDTWKMTKSMRLAGVYTNRRKFYKGLRKMITKGDICVDKDFIDAPLENYSIRDLNNGLVYCYIEEINSNEPF